MPKAIFVSQFEPKPVGHGGNHRAYQIVHDLAQVVGRDNVVGVSWPVWRRAHPARSVSSPTDLIRLATLRRIGRRIAPLRAAVHLYTGRTTNIYSSPEFREYYKEIVQSIAEPAICVIEHAGFADLSLINLQQNIPTVACVANIESFDRNVPLPCAQQWKIYLTATDFADEFRALARCDERLFISKVETGLIGGLGLSVHYYPYLPVGIIRQNLERIRRARAEENVKSGLFLMLGSSSHTSTWQSFSWFVQNAQKHGLPDGVRVVVGGMRTDKLLPPKISIPSLELRGWLEQDALDNLLIHAQAVLAPQTVGFGALTRLPELSCAGIPVLVSRHPTYAIDPPPGLEIVDDDWGAWYGKMKQMVNRDASLSQDDYYAWEKRQSNALEKVVKKVMENLCTDGQTEFRMSAG